MLPHRFPRPLRLVLYVVATTILLYLCLAPRQQLPNDALGDKPEHGIAWFVLTLSGYILAPRRVRAIPVYALLLGGLVEVLQASMGMGRHGDWRDLGSDVIGIAMAVVVFLAWRRWGPRRA